MLKEVVGHSLARFRKCLRNFVHIGAIVFLALFLNAIPMSTKATSRLALISAGTSYPQGIAVFGDVDLSVRKNVSVGYDSINVIPPRFLIYIFFQIVRMNPYPS